MLRIAICEDVEQDALLLRKLLEQYLHANSYEGHVDVFASGEELLAAFQPQGYHIAFLDIYMCKLNGIQTARALRKLDDELALIFLTTSEAHAMESYAVRAIHYLAKPLTVPQLWEAMNRCAHLLEEYARCLEVFSNRCPVKIRLRDILYIETIQRNSLIHTAGGEIKTILTMEKLEALTGGVFFARCHRGYLINLRRIVQFADREIILQGGARIPVGGAYAGEFKRQYTQFALSLARS